MRIKNEIHLKANKHTYAKIPNKYALDHIYDKLNSNLNITENKTIRSRIDSDGKIMLDIACLNSCGIKNNKIFINELCKESDILCLQELLHGQAKILSKHIDTQDKQIIQRCGTKGSVKGRYSGGLAFIVNKNINVTKSEFRNNNIGIIYINKLAVINVYLPYYCGKNSSNTFKFEEDINWLKTKIRKIKNEKKEIIICGDFNTDFSRQNIYSKLLTTLIIEMNLIPIDIIKEQLYEHTYEKKYKTMVIRSWIDHVLINSENEFKVKYLKILRGGSNTSDHYVLKIKYELKLSIEERTIENCTSTKIKEIKWFNSNERLEYNKIVLESSNALNSIIDDHKNANCSEERILIGTIYFNELSSICIKANNKVIENKSTGKKLKRNGIKFSNNDEDTSYKIKQLHKKKCNAYIAFRDSIPAWNHELGIIYYSLKKSLRQLQRYADKNKANQRFKELNDLFKTDKNGFWRDVKKMNRIKQLINVPIEQIKNIYTNLFNTSNIPDERRDEEDENKLDELIKNFLETKTERDEIIVTDETIKNIISNLNNGKAIGFSNVSNEMLKYGLCDTISGTMAYMMQWIINTGEIPKLFNISLLKPLIKDEKKSSEDPNNLRPLSISDVYPSIYEQIIAYEVKKDHDDHQKQFGFKPNSSCAHATFILNETIRLSKELKRNLIIISIDASKAFDRVNRTKLWIQMFEMNIRPILIISLQNYYKSFFLIVNNDNDYSSLIKTSYGVKQGGNISPDLYKLYTEPIAGRIEAANIGVRIGKLLVNVLMYADDVILLANTIEEAQTMLNIVTEFGQEFQIKYNPNKTNVMIESSNKAVRETKLYLCGEEIVKTNQIKYLGSDISNNGKARNHLEIRKSKSIASLNGLRTAGILNNDLDIQNKIKLYNIYIKPLMYYGIESSVLNKGDLDLLDRAEGNNLKTVIGIPYKCHSHPIYGALKMLLPNEYYNVQQNKFIIRATKNAYLEDFIKESLKLNTNNNIVGIIKKRLLLRNNESIEDFKIKLQKEIDDIHIRVNDRLKYNQCAKETAKIFETKSHILRNMRLIKKLHYTNYK